MKIIHNKKVVIPIIAVVAIVLGYLAQSCVIRVKEVDIRTKQETDKNNKTFERK